MSRSLLSLPSPVPAERPRLAAAPADRAHPAAEGTDIPPLFAIIARVRPAGIVRLDALLDPPSDALLDDLLLGHKAPAPSPSARGAVAAERLAAATEPDSPSAQRLRLLVTAAWGVTPARGDIHRTPLSNAVLAALRELVQPGEHVRLLASAWVDRSGRLRTRVGPLIVDAESPLALADRVGEALLVTDAAGTRHLAVRRCPDSRREADRGARSHRGRAGEAPSADPPEVASSGLAA